MDSSARFTAVSERERHPRLTEALQIEPTEAEDRRRSDGANRDSVVSSWGLGYENTENDDRSSLGSLEAIAQKLLPVLEVLAEKSAFWEYEISVVLTTNIEQTNFYISPNVAKVLSRLSLGLYVTCYPEE